MITRRSFFGLFLLSALAVSAAASLGLMKPKTHYEVFIYRGLGLTDAHRDGWDVRGLDATLESAFTRHAG